MSYVSSEERWPNDLDQPMVAGSFSKKKLTRAQRKEAKLSKKNIVVLDDVDTSGLPGVIEIDEEIEEMIEVYNVACELIDVESKSPNITLSKEATFSQADMFPVRLRNWK